MIPVPRSLRADGQRPPGLRHSLAPDRVEDIYDLLATTGDMPIIRARGGNPGGFRRPEACITPADRGSQ